MRSLKKAKAFLLLIAAVFLALMLWAGVTPPDCISAEGYSFGAADYTVKLFDAEITVHENREIEVVNTLTVEFPDGKHGIIFDLPLERGVRYRNFRSSLNGGEVKQKVKSEQAEDGSNILSVALGDRRVPLQAHVPYEMMLSYVMTVPALEEEGYLPLDVVGFGWNWVEKIRVKVAFPQGLENLAFYSGRALSKQDSLGVGEACKRTETSLEFAVDGGGGIENSGVTVDFGFAAGVLSVAPDLTVLYVVLVGAALVALAVLTKLFICRQPQLVKPVNLTAPDDMDPLLMGKLIDNKIDGEDFGSLVFYLASNDYLTIDMTEGEKDPVLIKTEKKAGDDLPEHCKIFYEGLFKGGSSVRVSDLNCSFYKTAEAVRGNAEMAAGKFYSGKGAAFLALFLLLSVLCLGGFIFLYSFITVSAGYCDFVTCIGCLFAYVFAALGSVLAAQRWYKWKRTVSVFAALGLALVGILIGMFLCIFSSALFSFGGKLTAVLFAAATGVIGGLFQCRTEEYSQKLGMVLGFKQFILMTERDKVEFMLKENPQIYYKVLPYAQVLGVTDAWTEKFKGLDMKPPSYARYDAGDVLFSCILWNSLSRSMCSNMGRTMVSKPSKNSGGHGFGGGFGGGHSGGFGGGGFGGGGGRSF